MLVVDIYQFKKKFKLSFPYNKELVDKIKTIDYKQREYSASDKTWVMNSITLLSLIETYKGKKDEIFFKFSEEKVREYFINDIKKHKEKLLKEREGLTRVLSLQTQVKNIKANLTEFSKDFDYTLYLKPGIRPYPHQIGGAIITNTLNNVLLAMDMGTGKTLTSLLSTESANDKKVVVIAPSGLRFNWANEIKNFTNSKYYIVGVKDKQNEFSLEESKYIIMSYNYFSRQGFDVNSEIKKLKLNEVETVICDESHKLKNTKTNTYSNFRKAFKNNKNRYILLSGTPILNRLEEIYTQLNLISPLEFKNKTSFYSEYCGMKYDQVFGWEKTDDIDMDKITNKLDGLMYRVKRHDVLKDLPKMVKSKIFIEMSPKEEKLYREIEEGFKNVDWNSKTIINEDDSSKNPLVILGKLRQFTANLKAHHLLKEGIVDRLNEEGKKVVIFDSFKHSLKDINTNLKHSALYTGDVSAFDRQGLVDKFQSDDNSLMNLLLTITAGNAGITLTKSSNMFMISQSYVPGENEQCYARINRIGQNDMCYIGELIVKDSVDERIYYLVEEKLKLISEVVDKEKYKNNSSTSILSDLLRDLEKQYKK